MFRQRKGDLSLFYKLNKLIFLPILFFFASFSSLFSFQGYFSDGLLKQVEHIPTNGEDQIEGKAVFCDSIHYYTGWGHAVQDTIIPIYKYLKDENLINEPVWICIKTLKSSTSLIDKANGLLLTIFPKAKIKIFTNESESCFFNDVETVRASLPCGGKDGAPHREFLEMIRSYGFSDNVIIDFSPPQRNIVHDFVDHVLDCYELNDVELMSNRVYLINKSQPASRRILNRSSISNLLEESGYEVLSVDFAKLSVREQIKLTRSCQFFISTHGSPLTNTMFLHNNATVLIIWPEDAKYFHTRFHCLFSAILFSKGNKIIEYDKPRSVRDEYDCAENIGVPDYFFNSGGQLYLKPEKKNWKDILNLPVSCMYDIYNVNMFIENPEKLIDLMKR